MIEIKKSPIKGAWYGDWRPTFLDTLYVLESCLSEIKIVQLGPKKKFWFQYFWPRAYLRKQSWESCCSYCLTGLTILSENQFCLIERIKSFTLFDEMGVCNWNHYTLASLAGRTAWPEKAGKGQERPVKASLTGKDRLGQKRPACPKGMMGR